MKKTKIAIISIFTSFIFGIIIFFSIPYNFPTINMAGSSAVSPLATIFASEYNDADIVVQSGGSGLGIQVAVDGRKDIGMASKNPFKNFDNRNPNTFEYLPMNWVEMSMKTITISWDGMGIVYKPPKDDQKFILNINSSKIISKIYLAFSGINKVSFMDVGSNTSKVSISPYARDGGGKQSGTAEAFFTTSGFNDWDINIKDKIELEQIKNALEKGAYGPRTIKTAESNSQAWDFFKSDNKYGSMIYLSAGFIINNYNEIINSGFKVAQYNGISINDGKITTGYNWYRPLNIMVSLKNDNLDIRKFIDWITTSSIALQKIKEAGYIELSNIQKATMRKDNNFWVSDEVLKFCGARNE